MEGCILIKPGSDRQSDHQSQRSLLVWACLPVSHLYGFGLMDAEAMVKEAERWKQVPSQHICVESADRQIRYTHTRGSPDRKSTRLNSSHL